MLARADVHAFVSTPDIAAVSATKSTLDTDQEKMQVKRFPMAHSLGKGQLGRKWCVQVSATPEKDIADSLVQRLKVKGYDGYVVQAEVKRS